MQFSDTLHSLRGRVNGSRPGLTPDFITNALNDRVRQVLDARTIWADLMTFGILSVPAPYTTGTIDMTLGDATVTGVDTAWPVDDVVNTVIPDGVVEYGYAEVVPASMQGITANSLLYVDADTDPEVVPVVEVRRASFVAKFTKQHNAGCTVTMSSLAGLQLRISQAYPVFTVGAVVSATELELTLPWGGTSLADQTYSIRMMYVVLASNLKGIIAMKDEATGFPVRLHVQLEEANFKDPRRTLTTGNPWYSLVDLGANEQGNMLFEMWPSPGTARQFSFAYWKQWPDMVKDTDMPPPFINPSIFYYGALADARMARTQPNDPYYDPEGARYAEAKFEQGMEIAKNADEAKVLSALRSPWWRGMQGNIDSYQLCGPELRSWDMGGGY